jgi:type II secretory pathway pseudopilin PulG
MPTPRFSQCRSGFTLVELMIYMGMGLLVALVAFSFLRSGTILGAKNANLNRSHDNLRAAFDRIAQHLTEANNVPTLINASGANQASGPAAGLKFDRVVGDPYVINPPLSAGSVTAAATSLTVVRAANKFVNNSDLKPPGGGTNVAAEGYRFLLTTPNNAIVRAKISTVSAHSPAIVDPNDQAATQTLTLGFSAPIGTAFSWPANSPQVGKIVRTEAFVVVPVGTRNELRYYKDFDPVPTMSDATKYVVLCDQIGTQTGDGTPFVIVDYNGDKIVQSTLRVRERGDAAWLPGEQFNSFNNYFQLHVNLPSRFRPRTTN